MPVRERLGPGRFRRLSRALLAAVVAVAGVAGAGIVPVEAQTSPAGAASFYVVNPTNNSVTAYAPHADGNVAPVATLSGPATRLSWPNRVAVDGAGRIFVHNLGNQTVTAYARGSDGNSAPLATISCCSFSGVHASLAVYGDRLYIVDSIHFAVRPYAIGPTGLLTAEDWLVGSLTGLENPRAVAIDGSGHLYVANHTAARITKYAPGATGNTSPVATISGPATGLARPSSLAVDGSGRLYVGDSTTNSVNVYAAGANGDTAPVATISGQNTGLDGVSDLAFDDSGRLVATNADADTVTVYAPGATGDVAPIATIVGTNTGLASPQAVAATPVVTITTPGFLPSAPPGEPYTYALAASGGTTPYHWSLADGAVLPSGFVLSADGVISGSSSLVGTSSFSATVTDATSHRATRAFSLSVVPDAVSSFYVANHHADSITRHAAGADGELAPVATIAGANTALSIPSGLLIDGAGHLYSANYGSSTITVYGPDASGDVTPVVTIAGTATGLKGPSSMVIDGQGRLYVSNYIGDSVTVYAPGATGDDAPIRTIVGDATGLSGPSALAFDGGGRLVVGNVDNNTVTIYGPGAADNAAPVATIGGTETGLGGPSGLLVDGSGDLVVANISANTLTKYASGSSGNVAPIATLAGPQTGLNGPRGVALDGSGRLIVTNSASNSVTQYAPGAHGDVFPVATLTGPATALRGSFAVVVVPPNQAPVCADGSATTPGDTPVATPLSCTDADGDSLTYTIVSGPTNGTLTGAAPELTYTPNPDYTGPDGFTYKANDGTADSNVSTVSVSVTSATFAFTGFFAPVNDPPAINQAKAGTAIPVKFSLGGDQGLAILVAGYPASRAMTCDASAPTDTIEETVAAGNSSLSYDASTGQYIYVWKTHKGWVNTCRQLVIKLTDGTSHTASFRFK